MMNHFTEALPIDNTCSTIRTVFQDQSSLIASSRECERLWRRAANVWHMAGLYGKR